MKRAHKTLDPALPSVVVTGSIAEMIGGGVTPEGTGIQRFLPRTIDEDQWQSANRAMLWLWTQYGLKNGKAPEAARAQGGRQAARQHHRAQLRLLQHVVGPRRDAPADRGHRRRGEPHVPARQPPAGRPAPRRRRSQRRDVPRVRTPAVRGARQARTCRRPSACTAPHASCARSASCSSSTPSRSSSARSTRPQADVGPVALGDAGLLRHGQLRHRRQRDLRARRARVSSRASSGCRATSPSSESQGRRRTTQAVRAAVQKNTPLIVFGSYNERMYLAEVGGKAIYIPASFPGTAIRRHTGTPFMGYSGASLRAAGSLQRAVRRAVQHPPARARSWTRSSPRPRACTRSCPGTRRPRRRSRRCSKRCPS